MTTTNPAADTASCFDQAITLHRAGRFAEATKLYAIVLQDNQSAPVKYFAGMAWLGLGKAKKAHEFLEQAAAESNRADYHFGHGNALFSLKRYHEAQAAFARAAALEPANSMAWFNLGNAAQLAKDYDTAAMAFRRTLDGDPLQTQALANLATALTDNERFDEFSALLRQAYELPIWKGNFVDLALIGIPSSARSRKKADVFGETLRALFAANPDEGMLAWLIGHFYFMRHKLEEARKFYLQAEALMPDKAGAKRELGLIFAARHEDDRARIYLTEAAEYDADADQVLKLTNLFIHLSDISPDAIHIFDILGDVYPDSKAVFDYHMSWLTRLSDHPAMAQLFEKRLKVEETVSSLVGLAAMLMHLRRDVEAVVHLRRAIKLDRKSFAAWFNLSNVYLNQNRLVEAYENGRTAFRLNPQHVDAAATLSVAAQKLNLLDESERILRRGLKHNPRAPELLTLLGNSKIRRGNMKEALECYAKARKHIRSGSSAATHYAMQLMSVNYSAEVPPATIADIHFKWGDATLEAVARDVCNVPPPAALKPRLKIGYMSGDYKNHSCAHFLGPVIANHHADRVEIFCYMTENNGDAQTLAFRKMAPNWRVIANMTDVEAAKLIQEDGIDILVDTSGHTTGCRLPLFAMKPAPIQVTWLGYPNTTGLTSMDYRFTDAWADPVGMTDKYYREQLYRLPNFLCYQPRESTPAVSELPAKSRGYITFGCFNNSNKITDDVVKTWAAILQQVENSKLILKTSGMSDQLTLDSFRRKFARNGVDPERIECFVSFPSKYDHLMTYSDIDLALDPFPYNGTTTTFEALWMGVPMIGLEGRVHAARVSYSIMSTLGVPELIAPSIKSYIARAVALAKDPDRIAAYRSMLRDRLRNSALMNGPQFATTLEDAYFDMWQHAVAHNQSKPIRAGGQRKKDLRS